MPDSIEPRGVPWHKHASDCEKMDHDPPQFCTCGKNAAYVQEMGDILDQVPAVQPPHQAFESIRTSVCIGWPAIKRLMRDGQVEFADRFKVIAATDIYKILEPESGMSGVAEKVMDIIDAEIYKGSWRSASPREWLNSLSRNGLLSKIRTVVIMALGTSQKPRALGVHEQLASDAQVVCEHSPSRPHRKDSHQFTRDHGGGFACVNPRLAFSPVMTTAIKGE